MKAVVIEDSGAISTGDVESPGQVIGGFIEAIYLGDNAVGFIDEEGKLKGRPENTLATHFARACGNLRRDDWIAGPMVIVGVDGVDETDVPDWVEETFRIFGELEQAKVERR